ncbi:MAG: hypothetical protein RSE00_05340 [Clostridia bacterium]
MNISKISRSIVVVIFVAFVVFLGYLDVISLFQKVEGTVVTSNLIKLGYAVLLCALSLIYVYIKDKLYRMKIKRKITFIYRYIYISIVIIVANILVIYKSMSDVTIRSFVIYMLFSFIIGFAIKKIVFNVSKSDVLSVFGMFAYVMLPNVLQNKSMYLNSIFITFGIIGVVLVLQLIIDELKQRGIRTKKYLALSVILGCFVGICMLMGISILVFVTISIALVLMTTRLDNTHISFSKKIMTSITQAKRETLYKIERINIPKLIISILIFLAVAIIVFFVGKTVIKILPANIVHQQVIQNVVENIKKSTDLHISFNMQNIVEYGKSLVLLSKTYYMMFIIYIILVEVLAILLRRRYDTKSSVMKLVLLLVFINGAIFNINVIYLHPVIITLLVLIAIVNTTNIYLNREERIKMLIA